MTETPALDLVADRKVVNAARWNTLRSPLCGVGGHWVNGLVFKR